MARPSAPFGRAPARVRLAVGVLARAVIGLRLISLQGTPPPELASCRYGASLRSLAVVGVGGAARRGASRFLAWEAARGFAARGRASPAPAESPPKRARKARRSRAPLQPGQGGRDSAPPCPEPRRSRQHRPRRLVASSGRGGSCSEIKRRPASAKRRERRAGTPLAEPERPPLAGRAIRGRARRAPNDLRRGQHCGAAAYAWKTVSSGSRIAVSGPPYTAPVSTPIEKGWFQRTPKSSFGVCP